MRCLSRCGCAACTLLGLVVDDEANPLDVIAETACVTALALGCAPGDVVVIVGEAGMGLPLDELAQGGRLFLARRRIEVVSWAIDAPRERAWLAPLRHAPPPAHLWLVLAAGGADGARVVVAHPLPPAFGAFTADAANDGSATIRRGAA